MTPKQQLFVFSLLLVWFWSGVLMFLWWVSA